MAVGAQTSRKPRLMIAGEFSAGKTQLINGLLGTKLLPSNVTATSLPPIWVIHGPGQMARVDLDGKFHDITSLDDVNVEDTLFCLVQHPSHFLKQVDLIDTPGNSDPNIPPECWERMLGFADSVVWCSNASQAWRQSEKSVWNVVDKRLKEENVLIITQADRLPDDASADKVMRRVTREANEYFQHFLMASLINAGEVAEIRELLQSNVIPHLTRGGADQPDVEAFRAKAPPQPRVAAKRPRRMARRKATEKVASEASKGRDASDVLARLELYTAKIAAPEPAPKPNAQPEPAVATSSGWAHDLWNEISGGAPIMHGHVPANLVGSLIAEVERLIPEQPEKAK